MSEKSKRAKLVARLREMSFSSGHHRDDRDRWAEAADEIERMAAIIVTERIDTSNLRAHLAAAEATIATQRKAALEQAAHEAAELEAAKAARCDCDFEHMEQSQVCPIHGELAVKLAAQDRELAALRPHIAVIAAESDGLYDAFKHRKAMEAFKKHLAAAPEEKPQSDTCVQCGTVLTGGFCPSASCPLNGGAAAQEGEET